MKYLTNRVLPAVRDGYYRGPGILSATLWGNTGAAGLPDIVTLALKR